MTVYLDHTATTKPTAAAIRCLSDQLDAVYANPASVHEAGRAADRQLQAARSAIAALLGCTLQELIMTSGGTEAINLALKGVLLRRSRLPRRLIISKGEHAAVRETAKWLEQQGIQVERLPLTHAGVIDLTALEEALKQPAGLISLIHVSNETGAVNPVAEAVALRNRLQPDALMHLDAVQTWGKAALHFSSSGIDLLSGSGHKLGAPKGIGWLIKRQPVRLEPLIHGGDQQAGMRSGTENPPLASALAAALEESITRLAERQAAVSRLAALFREEVRQSGIPCQILSPADGVPHILCIAFPGLRGETLVNALSAERIYISAGSACSSRRRQGDPVLSAMGLDLATVRSAVRISFAADNTPEEIKQAAQAIAAAWKRLA